MMTPPDETSPPSEPAAVVRAGQARVAVLLALADVAAAMGRLEALSDGIARALDATAGAPEAP
jgi:hypothetical protein